MRVLMMAGGTGGHVFPALAVAEELKGRGHQIEWLGIRSGMEVAVAEKNGYAVNTIDYKSPRGQGSLVAAMKLIRAVLQARKAVAGANPRLIVGMGGYTSVPGGIAGWLARIPLVIHEQNLLAGKANRLLAKIATKVLTAYPGTLAVAEKKAQVVGNPVRKQFERMPPPEERMRGREGAIKLLVLGGSQGARFLNENLPGAIGAIPEEGRPRVVHQCGAGNSHAVEAAYAEHGVNAEVHEFIDDVAAAMEGADLFAGRCGAATLAEIAAAGLGAILFPYPHAAEQHQLKNAEFFARSGAAVVFEEKNFAPERLSVELGSMTRERATEMARAARAVSGGDAARKFADACEEVAGAA